MPAKAGIHDFPCGDSASKTWMAGTGPAMTVPISPSCPRRRASTSFFQRFSKQDVDGRDIGEPPGLAFGKPKGELRDAVLRTAMPGHDDVVRFARQRKLTSSS